MQQRPRRPAPPSAATRQIQDIRLSIESRASEHALDQSYTQNQQRRISNASSQNTADDTANLNFNDMPEMVPVYKAVPNETAYKTNDNESSDERTYRRLYFTIFRGCARPIGAVVVSTLWCALAVVITFFTRRGYGPHENGDCRWWCTPLAVDGDALNYVGFALFLLTSFRASEAYARYMEAARVWTNISGTITSFAKYVVQAFPSGMIHEGDRERILSFLVAYPIALKRDLRKERDLRELKSVLAESDLARLQNADSMASYCLYVLSGYMLKAREQENRFPQTFIVHLIRWIADLAGAADVCNQIKVMPAPYSYVTHLTVFMALWLFFLPFAIVETSGWGTIVIVAFISYGILGVVYISKELEDPFGNDFNDLPLGRMASKIQDDVAQIYETYRHHRDSFITEPPKDDLSSKDSFWLNAAASKESGLPGSPKRSTLPQLSKRRETQ